MPPLSRILIIGAGPSGLLLALLLSKHGIPTTVLEASSTLDPQPRAAHYGPPALPDLARAGILKYIRHRGMVLSGMTWWRLDEESGRHEKMTGLDGGVLSDLGIEDVPNGAGMSAQARKEIEDERDWRTTCYPMQDLDQLMLDEFTSEYGGEVLWRHKVVGVGQDEGKAWVDVEVTTDGSEEVTKKRIEGDYVVGCDGANSTVRKSLFGDEFPGFTWDAQIIATNTYYDFDKHGFQDANFTIHPDHFFLAGKLSPTNFYRITYGDTPGLSVSEYRARLPLIFQKMLPGHPSPSSNSYTVENFAPYKMHQRCAPSFRVGRVLLAADAAHLCNPWGGMGITGGFVDVGGLYDIFAGIHDEKISAPEEMDWMLDMYSKVRIAKWKDMIDPISQENFRRVSDKHPETMMERDGFLGMCVKAEGDQKLARELMVGGFELRYDFTKHFGETERTHGGRAAEGVAAKEGSNAVEGSVAGLDAVAPPGTTG